MKRPREDDDEQLVLCGELSWCRGPMIGRGGFGSVYRAELKKPRLGENGLTSIVAVKSVDPSKDYSLLWEKTVLDALQGCPHVLQTFGADTTKKRDGYVLYNVLLEFALGGSLADLIENLDGNGLCESDVRKYTKSILIGLKHIHACGFVHCDLKPDNVLLVPKADGFELKVSDFGLSKRVNNCGTSWRGMPLYLAPECVKYGVQDTFSDIWALGCTMLIMLIGRHVWDTKCGSKEYEDLITQIGSDSVPYIPEKLSATAKDFLMCCFVINPMDRMTADALLEHPFVAELDDKDSHIQVSEEAANAKGIRLSSALCEADNKCSFSAFRFGCSFIPLPDSSSEEEVIPETQVSKEAETAITITSAMLFCEADEKYVPSYNPFGEKYFPSYFSSEERGDPRAC